MGRLVLHAGRGKTGTSSIQRWLAEHASWLRTQHGTEVLAVVPGNSTLEVAPPKPGSSKSVLGHAPLDTPRLTELFEQFDRWLSKRDVVVVTSEGFGAWFYDAHDEILRIVEVFGAAHDICVAYYVRPQHTVLEAHWRQWGFRTGLKPSDYLRGRLQALHYLATADWVRNTAPSLSFVVRPYRNDLLVGGNVVSDFTRVFLGLEHVPTASSDVWENQGLSLDVVNVLRHAPPGLFWTSPHDNEKLGRLRNLGLAEWPITESTNALRSRIILQAFCYEEYEPENEELIRRLSWPTDHFVPPAGSDLDEHDIDLTELDRLWEPDGPEQERELLFHALSALLERPPLN
jgi:hypothetical protein